MDFLHFFQNKAVSFFVRILVPPPVWFQTALKLKNKRGNEAAKGARAIFEAGTSKSLLKLSACSKQPTGFHTASANTSGLNNFHKNSNEEYQTRFHSEHTYSMFDLRHYTTSK